jgi:hypothetical protein
MSKVHVSTAAAPPQVHRMDKAMLAHVKRMAAEGASLDDICKMVDPRYPNWDDVQRTAFRQLIRAVIDSGAA